MDRLTIRDDDGAWDVPLRGEDDGAYFPSQEIFDRLAAYEDTGLEPEEVEACKVALMGKSLAEIEEIEGISVERMKALAKAEAEDKLLVLPCKVGDTVWAFGYLPTSSRYVIYCAEVKEFRIREKHFGRDISVLLEPVDFRGRRKEYGEDDFGKTVFLTREEAETALRKEPDGNN